MSFFKFEGKNTIKEGEEHTPINEILSYGVMKDNLHIHLIPTYSFSRQDKVDYLRSGIVPNNLIDGLKKLAIIVQGDNKIKKISATSPVVSNHPEIFEKLGFKYHGKVEYKQYNNLGYAEISREDFLKKYCLEQQ